MSLHELTQIGLTKGEIKIYEALLDLGECTKSALAKKSGISPSNIYDVTNRLLEKGIISKVEKNGVAHFSPSNPKNLIRFLHQKEKEIEKEKEVVNDILPLLSQKFQKVKETTKVESFYGWNGLKTIFEDLLEECRRNEICYVFGASKGENEEKSDRFFIKYSKLREKKGIETQVIFNEELRNRKERVGLFKKSKLYNFRYLKQTTPAEIMIYKNTVCIIVLTKDPLVIRITGNESADSFLQYFKDLWKIAK